MGLFDTIRRAVGGDGSAADGDERTAGGDRPADDGPDLLDTASLDPAAFRTSAEHVVDGADPLTFDPPGLARLDAAIEESYDGETAETDGATTYTGNTVRFGSYLGEVLVRAYGGEWVQSEGRWGVTVAGPDDSVTVAVFDVARRSFRDEPVFAAVVTRLESELALDTDGPDETEDASAPGESDADGPVSEPTRVVSRVDDAPDPGAAGPDTTDSPPADRSPDDTAGESPTVETGAEPSPDTSDGPTAGTADAVETTAAETVGETTAEETIGETTAAGAADGTTADEAATYIDEAEPGVENDPAPPSDEAPAASPAGEPAVGGSADSSPADDEGAPTARPWDPGTVRAAHADTAVEFAEFWGEHDLDFSPASLSRLDGLVDSEWDDERFAETTFGSDASFDDRAFTSVVRELGGYFGEVLVRQLDGEWTDGTDHEAAVVVTGPAGQFAVPVFRVAITSLRKQAVFGRSYDALLADLGRDGPAR
jgi:hypothetical protein